MTCGLPDIGGDPSRRAEEGLRESERLVRELVEASCELVFLMNPDGSAMRPIGGRSATRYTGSDWLECCVHPRDRTQAKVALEDAVRRKTLLEFEHRVAQEDGACGWMLTRAIPRLNDAGEVVEWFAMADDVTARRQSEQVLHEVSQRNEAFMATLAHELRNPLAPILQAAAIVGLPEVTQAQLRWSQAVIERQVRRMAKLLDDLLDISRITRGRLTLDPIDVSVAEVLDVALETARPLITARSHRLITALPDDPPRLHADPLRLSQVLANLLTNAAKYTPPQGEITVSVRHSAAEVEIAVADNGVGIDPAHIEKMFEMFAQGTRPDNASGDGLGIGLALARGLVELHGGTLTASSRGLGQGTEFVVRLPADVRGTPA